MDNDTERNPRRALGKGLSALLPPRAAPVPANRAEEAPPSTSGERLEHIPLEQIRPNEEQPRDRFDEGKLEELTQSIRANGLIQPIVVHQVGAHEYRLIAGERRWRAAKMAGLHVIPAFVRQAQSDQLLELALIENLQREDLNPIEIATAFHRLATEHHLSHEQIAERTGKDRSTITNFVRLLKLSARVCDEVARGTITMGHARALVNIEDELLQVRACGEIIARNMSVRETERYVKTLGEPRGETAPDRVDGEAKPLDPNVRAAVDEMSAALGTRVRLVQKSGTSGRLEIEYYSGEDLERIYSVIVKA